MLLQNALITHEARPVICLFDLFDVRARKIASNTFIAEHEWAGGTAENFTTLATPSAIVL